MRKYENNQLVQVVCNNCEKRLQLKDGYIKEGCFSADYLFGYFSGKDTLRHRFDLCEDCYDKIVAGFRIPVEESTEKELL
ncbi:MAG: hypothetical protein K6G30_05385 [Acetatifactor sp.]|nr:hypothetical protein [Acetatifactor sp.]